MLSVWAQRGLRHEYISWALLAETLLIQAALALTTVVVARHVLTGAGPTRSWLLLVPHYFLDMIGARPVGTITEHYPEVRNVTSDVYYLFAPASRVSLAPNDALYPLHRRLTRLVTALGWVD